MDDTLAVRIDRVAGETSRIEVADSFAPTGPFAVRLVNAGPPVHVYLGVDDALAEEVNLPASNHFLDRGATRTIEATLHREDVDDATGTIEVVTGHGAERASVEVTLSEPETVDVDESLTRPAVSASESKTTRRDRLGARDATMLAGVVAGVAVVVAAAAVVGDAAALALGVLAVAVGAGAGLYFVSS